MNVPNSIKIAKVEAKFCQSLPKETFKMNMRVNDVLTIFATATSILRDYANPTMASTTPRATRLP